MPLAATFAQFATAAGYGPDDPLVVALARAGRPTRLARGCLPEAPAGSARDGRPLDPAAGSARDGRPLDPAAGSARDGRPLDPAAGSARDGRPLDPAAGSARGGPTAATLMYLASLGKQVTAACAALLVRDGVLDVDTPVAEAVPGLPRWSRGVRLRHLVHHTSGLSLGGEPTSLGAGRDLTTAWVLAGVEGLEFAPGTRYSYSNVGYVFLAEAVRVAAGEPLPGFARRRIFEPLGMTDTVYWPGPEPFAPGGVPLDPVHPAPLALGPGGLWSTADDLLRWCAGLDADRLGITALMQTPGRLDDGSELDYAWGMGVRRTRAGASMYRHGGRYARARTMLVRVPELGLDLVILAPADGTDRSVALTNALVDFLT